MGINDTAVAKIQGGLVAKDRTYAWLARAANIPYKRVLSEIKHGTRALELETAIEASRALGMTIVDIVEDSGTDADERADTESFAA